MTLRPPPWLIAGAGVLVAGVLAYRAFWAPKAEAYRTEPVVRGRVVEEVTETGTVVSSTETDLYFKSSGRVAKVLAKEGEAVKAETPLMTLDTVELSIRRREALAAAASAEAKYAQAVAGASAEDLKVLETAVRNAQASLDAAERSLADTRTSNDAALDKAYADLSGQVETLYLKASAAMQTLKNDVFDADGNTRSDILASDFNAQTQASAAFIASKDALARMDAGMPAFRSAASREAADAAATALASDAKIVRVGAQWANTLMQGASPGSGTSQTSFDTRKASVKSAWTDVTSAVNSAESQVSLVASTKSSNAVSLGAAEAAVTSAGGALDSAERELEARRAPLRQVDKAVYLAAIASARASLSLIDQEIADAALRAPSDGIVGTVDLEPGELATPTVRAVSMISPRLEIEADVSELDIDKLAVGGPAEAVFDALGGASYVGRIVKIATREKDEDGDIFYPVKAILDDETAPLRTGMTADLSFRVGEKEGVLLVPRRAVRRSEGKSTVLVLRGGKPVEVEIVLGLRGADAYEVVSGLEEGEATVIERL
jgi:multidrug efflux pump subunit AcrA (membrane-fusion protein)